MLLATENNYDKLWNVLEKHTNSKLIKSLRTLHNPKIDYDKDCISRGPLKVKWLVDQIQEIGLDPAQYFYVLVGMVLLCPP